MVAYCGELLGDTWGEVAGEGTGEGMGECLGEGMGECLGEKGRESERRLAICLIITCWKEGRGGKERGWH